jgi:integrase
MLTIRRRGRLWHIRGSIRVGRESSIVKEHSTGCDRKEDAEAYRSRLEADIRRELLHGPGGRPQSMNIADAGLAYMNGPGGVRPYDLWRLDQLNNEIGDWPISRAAAAFAEFTKQRCAALAPATVDRFRCVLQAALNYAARNGDFDAPKVHRTLRIQNKRIRFLSKDQEARLLNTYANHVRPIAITLCFQGLRIGEALRLDWQRHRELYRARPATPLGVVVRDERYRSRNVAPGGRLGFAADGRTLCECFRRAPG